MKYYVTIQGIIIDENHQKVVMEEGTASYNDYLSFLNDGGTVEPIDIEFDEVPQSVSIMHFWLSVYELLGITEEYVTSIVNAMSDIQERTKILIMLNKAQEFDRSNQMLNYMANELGISQGQLDLIFIMASKLEL